MSFGGIGADHENTFGLFEFVNCIGHRSAAEGPCQTSHRRSVAQPRTMIHIIGSDDSAKEFLENIIVFVRAFS